MRRDETLTDRLLYTIDQNGCHMHFQVHHAVGIERIVMIQQLTGQTNAVRLMNGWMNQAYSRLSTTHGHITDCKLDSVAYAGVSVVILLWTCLVWAERPTPANFWVPSHRSIPPQVSRKESLKPFILTPSRPVGCLTHYCQAPS